ncbi:kinase-like domain-containing protein [Astrocystis sublimbata]|nr:kinase-like domain-containing protein [Astrocystis sublimbata]
MVKIHHQHHKFDNKFLSGRGFAIKSLNSPDREIFEREKTILGKFKGDNQHENMVTLLATYELTYKTTNRFALIFYRADGNLFHYWQETNPSPEFVYTNIQWVSEQCKGLADGLSKLHYHLTWPRNLPQSNSLPDGDEKIRQYGRHGDLKPENILCYPKQGSTNPTLTICDFGGSELRFRMTGSGNDGLGTRTYRAPESDDETPPGPSADIWSLGCVYLEFVAWILGGAELVKDFVERRLLDHESRFVMGVDTFFKTNPGGERFVKKPVIEFIDEAHSNPRCTQYLHDFLDIIEGEMLVVEPKERIKCRSLHHTLNTMFEKCQSGEDYAMKASPRPETPTVPHVGPSIVTSPRHIRRSEASRGVSEQEKSESHPQSLRHNKYLWEKSHTTK